MATSWCACSIHVGLQYWLLASDRQGISWHNGTYRTGRECLLAAESRPDQHLYGNDKITLQHSGRDSSKQSEVCIHPDLLSPQAKKVDDCPSEDDG